MGVSVQISFYPLGTGNVNSAVDEFLDSLRRDGLALEVGSMSTVVWGNAAEVFDAIRRAYELTAATRAAVLTMTVSNACPVPDR
jgi:uncharacterized protein YqgV (UPF0045/DUF77 family)